MKAAKVATKINETSYLFIYQAQASKYDTYWPTIERMINSIKTLELLDYENFDIGMRVKYPPDWDKTEEPYSRILSSENVSSVLFYPLAQGDSMHPSTELRISSYLTDKSLDEEVNQTISDYRDDFIGHPKFYLFGINSVNLKNLPVPSYMFNYSYMDPFSLKNIIATEIITNLTNKVYSITHSAEVDEFTKGPPILNSLINTFENFGVSRYEIPVANQSGIILRYPNEYPWDLNKTDDKNVNLMRENFFNPSIWQHFFLSVYPYNKNLTELENELEEFYDKYRFQILNENKTESYRTTLDGNVTAHRVEFSYYDKNTNEDVNGVQVSTVYNNYAFIITYVTEPSRYDKYLPSVEEVIDSVKIITPVKDVGKNLVTRHLQGGLISDIEHPRSWNFTAYGIIGFEILSPTENIITDHFNESMFMMTSAAGDTSLGDSVGQDINNIKQQNLTNFVLGDSHQINFLNNTAHKIIYSFKNDKYEDLSQDPCRCDLQVMTIYTIINKKLYTFVFTTEQDKFRSYLPTFENIMDSIVMLEKGSINKDKSGLPLNGRPVDLAINPATNKLYVANPEARQVQVIDGLTDRIIENITVGANPNALTLNQFTNRIYAASPETDIIYVIDGITNNITSRIPSGPLIGDVAIDTNEFGGFGSLVFVSNTGGVLTKEGMMGSVSIIDDIRGKVVANVVTEPNPFGIAIDTIRNRAYITTISGVDVIDYSTSSIGRKVSAYKLPEPIYAGTFPTGIVVDSSTSRAYITNSANDTVSVIDTASNEELKQIGVGLFPWSIAFNPSDKKLYVANSGINTVSIIDTTSDSNVGNIPIDGIPSDVTINPNTNIVYLANPESRTISTIDANANKPVSATIFRIHPPGAGHIECDESDYWEKIPENKYRRIIVDSQCKAIPNSGFKFSSWSEGEPRSNLTGIPGNFSWFAAIPFMIGNLVNTAATSPVENFTVTQYGTYTANFLSSSAILQALSPIISVGTLLLVILLAAVAPNLRVWKSIKKKKVERSEKNIQTITISAYKVESSKEKDKVDELPYLSRGEILTIDATVIIGVLLFLTLTEGFETSEQYQINIITASIVFPFAISAIIGVTKHEGFATRLMIAGFINLMISVVLIAGMKL
jgi:YVTN family beta-propeller protein